MHPKVQECASAVRADSDTAIEMCAAKKVELFDDSEQAIIPECRRAMATGLDTRKVPQRIRWVMLREFEAAMKQCTAPPRKAPTLKRDTVKLSD